MDNKNLFILSLWIFVSQKYNIIILFKISFSCQKNYDFYKYYKLDTYLEFHFYSFYKTFTYSTLDLYIYTFLYFFL